MLFDILNKHVSFRRYGCVDVDLIHPIVQMFCRNSPTNMRMVFHLERKKKEVGDRIREKITGCVIFRDIRRSFHISLLLLLRYRV